MVDQVQETRNGNAMRSEPFALHLYRRFLGGESVQQLAIGLSIPEDRVGQRICAATLFCERQKAQENPIAPGGPPGAGRPRPPRPTIREFFPPGHAGMGEMENEAPDAVLPPERMEGAVPDYRHWELPETGISIRLSLEVMDRLEREALESFRSITKRGSEIGGLLLGQVSRDPRAIAITDYELVACDYSRGPLYQLSEEDERRLEAAVARPRESLSVVGFFRSNTRKELALDANDAALTERYFPSRDSLVLLVKPFSMKPSLGGFFLREHGPTSPSIEFAFRRSQLGKDRPVAGRIIARHEAPGSARFPARAEQALAPASVAVTEDRVAVNLCAPDEAMAPPEPANPVPAPAPAPPQEAILALPHPEPDTAGPAARRNKRPLWVLLLAAALSGAVYSGYNVSGPGLRAPVLADDTLALKVERAVGQLRLNWNRTASVIATAQKATLSIVDGAQEQTLNLDLGQLRTGSLVYSPSTPDVSFRLELIDLKNGKSVSESIWAAAGRPSPLGPLLVRQPDRRDRERGLSPQIAAPTSSTRRLAPIALSRPLRHRTASDR